MRAVDIIRAKRDGEALARQAIDAFVAGVLDGSWADYQVSALLMAIVLRGMTPEETADLTDAMVRSGRRVDLSPLGRPTVGKHSTGGVGDKISIVLAPRGGGLRRRRCPRCRAAAWATPAAPSTSSSRFPASASRCRRRSSSASLGEVGCAIVGQTADIAPADKTLYALRDVTATIESVPLISASVMSKKIAEGSEALVLDVKCGRGAFMKTLDAALALARSLVAIGTAHGVRTEAFVTAMDGPLGRAVGNALEIEECLEVLAGGGPADVRALVETLGARARAAGRTGRAIPTRRSPRCGACSATDEPGPSCGRWWRRREAIPRWWTIHHGCRALPTSR